MKVESVGTAPFTVTEHELESEFFRAGEGCAGETLAPGEDCSFEVRYAPGPGGEPHTAELLIHQTLSGPATRVRLEGTGSGVTPTVDLPAPTVESCSFAAAGSGQLQAQLRVSLAGSEDQTVAVRAGLAGEAADEQEVAVGGATVDLVVPIPEERAQAGLVIEVEADARGAVAESDETNNVRSITSTSAPVAGALCGA